MLSGQRQSYRGFVVLPLRNTRPEATRDLRISESTNEKNSAYPSHFSKDQQSFKIFFSVDQRFYKLASAAAAVVGRRCVDFDS